MEIPVVGASELGRYWRTARHLRVRQASYWLRHRMLKPAWRATSAESTAGMWRGRDLEISLRQPVSDPQFPQWEPAAARRMIERREFEFLNRTCANSPRIPWAGSGLGRLWDYHLHYFDYLNLDLTAIEDEPLLRAALAVARDWIDSNPRPQGCGWEAYPLSLRIVNWLKFLARHAERLQQTGCRHEMGALLASLGEQVAALEAGLEDDVLTNHLLKNAKALIFAGILLDSARSGRWLERGIEIVKREIAEQVLADGGHFQRSPMYHAQVLEDFLDLENVLAAWTARGDGASRAMAGEVQSVLRQRIAPMSAWLEAMIHPDGEIPLLNDSALGMASSPRVLRERTRGVVRHAPKPAREVGTLNPAAEVQVLGDSGYATIRHDASRSFLVFDCGPLGPAYQPGHGHCDLLSFELSLDGKRVVVDTGTSTYDTGPERSYERSTAAHNTLRIDGEEQAEMWASFRVGRRPRVGQLTGAAHGAISFVMGRYAARGRHGVTHARAMMRDADGVWWFVDWLEGRGEHCVEAWLHFHPQIEVALAARHPAAELLSSGLREQAVLQVDGHAHRLLAPASATFRLEEACYAPEFGLRVKNTVASWRWQYRAPAMSVFALAPMEQPISEVRLMAERGCCRLGQFELSLLQSQ